MVEEMLVLQGDSVVDILYADIFFNNVEIGFCNTTCFPNMIGRNVLSNQIFRPYVTKLTCSK